MKRSLVFLVCLMAANLAGLGVARAENVVFRGKAVCPVKCDIRWPFSTDAAKAVRQDKGIGMAVSLQPEPPESERSGVAKGSPMRALHVLTVKAEIGQMVKSGQEVMTYELPKDQVISEREHLSRAKLDKLAQELAQVNFLLEKLDVQQQEMAKAATSIKTVPPSQARTASLNFEALLKKRDALTDAYTEAKARYEDDIKLAHDRFGKDVTALELPRSETAGACIDGYILWKNSSCVPGATFTKDTTLFTFGQMDPILVRAEVHEIDAHKLHVGDRTTITFETLPGQTFHSTIAKIDYIPQPPRSQEPSFYQVEMSVPNPDVRIKEGMRCDITTDVTAGK